jgi:hypothetical protein
MIMSDQDRFSLQDYFLRSIAGDDDIPIVELKPMRESDYIWLPYIHDINEKCLRLCSWNVHVTTR